MLLFACGSLVPGLLVGLARGGRLRHLLELDLRAWAVPWSAFLAQLASSTGWGVFAHADVRAVVLIGSYLAVGAWLFANLWSRPRLRSPLAIVASGWLLNVVVMTANGGMPVSAWGLRVAGLSRGVVSDGNLLKHVPADHTTHLRWLGDVLPIPALQKVISVGDIFMLAGIAVLIATALTTGAGRAGPHTLALQAAR